MKTVLALFTITILSAHAMLADLVIVQNVKTTAQGMNVDMEMTMHFKGSKARIDVGDQVSTIMDSGSDEVLNLMHQQKMVMTMNSQQLGAMQQQMTESMGKDDAEQAKPELKATGNKETINGFDTEEYLVTQNGQEISYWLAKDYPNKEKILEQMASMQDSKFAKLSPNAQAQLDIRELPGIPIRVNAVDTVMTLVSVEEKKVDPAIFEIPEGYNKMDMPDLGNMLKNMPQGE